MLQKIYAEKQMDKQWNSLKVLLENFIVHVIAAIDNREQ